MGKYRKLVDRFANSVDYWTQAAMRRFVLDVDKRMVAQEISRAKLAEKIGASPAYVTKALRGDVNFTLESMTKFALAVGGKLHVEIVNRDSANRWASAEWYSDQRAEAGLTRKLEISSEYLVAANEGKCQQSSELVA